jgi:hypothetical protein
MQNNVWKYAAMPVLALAMTAAPALAEGLGIIKVTIPFQFIAGKAVLPAGEYQIKQENNSGLIVINGDKASAMVITTSGEAVSSKRANTLNFEKSTSGPVLREVKLSGTTSSVLPAGR